MKSLFIENLAVIEQVSMDFSRGFTVLTGETGAGKSIIIDAINMVLGERSSRDMVRTGASCATVIASFSMTKATLACLRAHDMEDADELIFERKIYVDGKSTAKLNGRPVNLAVVKELGALLLNIHGQHDSQHLLATERHIEYLDNLSQTASLLATYRGSYEKAQNIKAQMRALQMNEQEKARKIELLRYQCDEISAADLQPDEDTLLQERKHYIQNSEKIASTLIQAYESLNSEENENALALLSGTMQALSSITSYGVELEGISAKTDELYYALADVAEEIRILRDEASYEPGTLDEIEERLDCIYRLRKKYGKTVEDILAYYDKAAAQLADIEISDEKILALANQLEVVYTSLNETGLALSAKRKKAALSIEKDVTSALHFLNMPAAKFSVSIAPLGKGEQAFGENGMDKVEFLITTNQGDILRPLSKIVSGGELSRVCLALKGILGKEESIGTLIFDEIDTGVSGSAAEKIGLKLKELAKNKQVLCVTHLSQIAALADHHLLIEKTSTKDKTATLVKELDKEARVSELARMISGAKITEAALESARQMLSDVL